MSDGASTHIEPRVTVIQDGSRLRYAVPLALQRQGALERVLTDFYAGPRHPVSRLLAQVGGRLAGGNLAKMRGRHAPELDASEVYDAPLLSCWLAAVTGRRLSGTAYFTHCREALGRAYARIGLGDANVVHGFVRNIPIDLCDLARQRGLSVSADQMIAPAAVEAREDRTQQERWGGWAPAGESPDYAAVEAVERATWSKLDVITCASDYVRDGLVEQGIAAGRIAVTPYPIDVEQFEHFDRSGRTGPITVGFVGAVGLRKGAPYFVETARRLAGANLRFVMLGPVKLEASVVEANRDVVEFVGAVPLAEVGGWLRRFDMIYFPTTCEGSAGALMEAMATGLPVVTSPNSGTVARDGQEGFIVAYDEIDAAADRLQRLADDAELRLSMGRAARARAAGFDLNHYGDRLYGVFAEAVNATRAGANRTEQVVN